MKNAFNRLRSGMETLNLTMLLILNLFFMVFLLLAVCTVLVLAGVDEGFLYHDGQVELGGALAFVYTVCILIAVSMVVMIRMVFIHPLQRNIEAMKKLANGDFTVRVNHAEHGYVPREMVEFEQSFNKAAEELGGTEILRKDFINNFSHEFKTPIVSISGFADLLLEEQAIVNSMHEALAREEFQVYFHPKYSLQTMHLMGAEALVRWQHPQMGMLTPERFISIFEKNGFISAMDEYVWTQVCRQLRRWLDAGVPVVPLSVNVSRVDIYHPRLCTLLQNLLHTYRLPPHMLRLEVTESACTDNITQLSTTINALRAAGATHLDDRQILDGACST